MFSFFNSFCVLPFHHHLFNFYLSTYTKLLDALICGHIFVYSSVVSINWYWCFLLVLYFFLFYRPNKDSLVECGNLDNRQSKTMFRKSRLMQILRKATGNRLKSHIPKLKLHFRCVMT